MGTLYWTGGAGDNSWQTAGNWSTAAIPVDGDDVIFDNGSISCTAGLTGHAAGNDNLNSLTITENYLGSIGSGATPLTLPGNISGTSPTIPLVCAGRGAFYKFNVTGTVEEARIDTGASTTVYLTGGTFTTVKHSGSGGELKLEAAIVTNLYQTSGALRCTADSATAFTIAQCAGQLTCGRNITTYTGLGGDRLTTTGSVTVTTANLFGRGSIFNHNSSGTITTLVVGPGASFPCVGSRRNFTVTTTNLWQGGSINRYPPGISVTYSTIVPFGNTSGSIGGTGGGQILP